MGDPQALRAATQLPPARQSPRAARRFVGEMLARWQFDSIIEPVQLLISELVTNAVLHAGTEVQVVLEVHDNTVHVEVIDLTDHPPVIRFTPYDDLQTGRGLILVDRIASAWGVAPLEHGKSVWFEVDVRPPAESSDVPR